VEFVLDASFTLHWCFEDEATPASDAVLTRLQNQTDSAWVPGIWPHELLNGLGKGITRKRPPQAPPASAPRKRPERHKAFSLWQEIRALPIRVIEVPVDEALL
jgi:hypothetical protein